jgi:hypothetical protein
MSLKMISVYDADLKKGQMVIDSFRRMNCIAGAIG